ncbi:MAG: hypothetical protein ACNA8W_10900 [Bradymonadaceae bacterium]
MKRALITAAVACTAAACSVICMSSPAWAQGEDIAPPAARPGVHDFDDITVKRISPEDIPNEGAFRPPAIVDGGIDDLPRMLSGEAMLETRNEVAQRTFEIIALVQPARPYRQTPMIYRGHAVWLSAKDDRSEPVLISTHDWLESAESYFLVPAGVETPDHPLGSQKGASNSGQQAPFRTLESVTSGGMDFRWLERHKSSLIELELVRGDRHRNLSAFRAGKDGQLKGPATGLQIFNARGQLPPQVFGFSPFMSGELIPALFIADEPSHESLAFYMQTTFPGILGAPIVSPRGHVIAMGAVRNPHKPEITLAIPPTSIMAFVKALQGLED